MADGEAIYELFYLVIGQRSDTPTLNIPAARTHDCCSAFKFKVLAGIGDEEFEDDRTAFLYHYDMSVSTATIELLKYDADAGDYISVATLNDTTYGTFKGLGFYINDKLQKYTGFIVDWKLVLADTNLGAGNYKVRCTAVSPIASDFVETSAVYCLEAYTPQRADGTIRVEYTCKDLMGDPNDDESFFDFGPSWYNQMRLNGFFGYPKTTVEKEYVRYTSGFDAWVKDEQVPEFIFKIKPVPAFIHNVLQYEVMQADDVMITDYNSNNAYRWIQKKVQPTSGYEPSWKPLKSRLAGIEIKFKPAFNNLKKRRN